MRRVSGRSLKLLSATVLLVLSLPAAPVHAVELRVASWNIANLHHRDNWKMFDHGTARRPVDFATLRKYARELRADVIALQEIGTKKAAERIFPPDEYDIRMSGRFHRNQESGIYKGIYTAIAVRKRDDVRIVQQQDLRGLSLSHAGQATRRGTGLLLEVAGTELWVLSVHLKSSCSGSSSSHERAGSSNDSDCRTFWRQRIPLKRWIDERYEDETAFVIAGDFNRRFRQFQSRGPFWKYINGGNLDPPRLQMHPRTVQRECATRRGNSTEPIDWILLDMEVGHWFKQGSFWETRFSTADVRAHGGPSSQRLSDHCPIHIDLEW